MKPFTSQGHALSLVLLSLGTFTAARSIRRDTPVAYPQESNTDSPDTSLASYNGGASSSTNNSLLPAVHWEYPLDDMHNLAPINTTDLYYSANGTSDPSVQHLFASLSTTLQYEAVVLDHSSFVRNISCSADGILVDFTTPEAFAFAASSWPEVQDFVLVTYTDGCGSSNTQRTFWLIDDLNLVNHTNSVLAIVRNELAIEDVLHGVELIWGTYHPPGSNVTEAPFVPNANSSANGAPCGSAPAATVDGFPTASCGDQDFDQELDNAIGYLDFGNGSGTQTFLQGAALDDTATAAYHRRGLFSKIKHGISSIVSTVKNAGKEAANAVEDGAKDVVDAGKAEIKSIGTFNPSVSKSADINLFPPADSSAPWPNAALVFSESASKGNLSGEINLYCVDCGVKGHVNVAGHAKFSIFHGLEALNAQINANIEAGLKIGLEASATFSKTETKQLLNQAIPDLGFSVDKIFSAGVFVTVDATATLEIDAEGDILVGVTMKLPNFSADLNVLDENSAKSSTVTGYEPEWEKTFEAKGSITATATVALPIGLHLGIEIVPIKFDKSIALIEQPSLVGKVTAAGSIGDGKPTSTTCNDGIEFSVNAVNDIKLDLFGIHTFDLEHFESPALISGCEQLPGAKHTTSTTSIILATSTQDQSSSTSTSDATTTADSQTTSTLITTTDSPDATTTTGAAISQNTSAVVNTTGSQNTTIITTTAISQDASTTVSAIDASETSVATTSTESVGGNVTSASDNLSTSTGRPVSLGFNATMSSVAVVAISETASATPTTTTAAPKYESPGSSSSSEISTPTDIAVTSSADTVTTTDVPNYGSTSLSFESTSTDDEDTTTTTTTISTSTEMAASDTSYATATSADVISDEATSTAVTSTAASAESTPTDTSESGSYGTTYGGSSYGSSVPSYTYKKRQASNSSSSDETFTFTGIKEYHGAFQLIPGTDGNLYTQAPSNNATSDAAASSPSHPPPSSSAVWASYSDAIVGDDQERFLYYYPDVMGAYNVSRIRLGAEDAIPKTAQIVALLQDPAVGNAHYAATTKGDTFGMAKCDFTNGADSKIFLARNDDGLDLLKSEKLTYTVTGASVKDCQWVAFVLGNA